MAPASLKTSTKAQSVYSGGFCAFTTKPQVVTKPRTLSYSLTAIGTPKKGGKVLRSVVESLNIRSLA
jgi:hypothetical protein